LTAPEVLAGLRRCGTLIGHLGGRLRACTHLDVADPMIEETLDHGMRSSARPEGRAGRN
jgi:hypothetical protein